MKVICLNCNNLVELIVSDTGTTYCPCCHTEDPRINFEPGTPIDGYVIRSLIGMGGMGVVYRALQINLKRDVALKVLNRKLANDETFVEQFFKEARSAACLSSPNIVQAIDAGVDKDTGVCYFVMELIRGETYLSIINREFRLSEALVREVALRIAKALAYAYNTQKISHGDIKPENLISDPVEYVKLADLGLAHSSYDETKHEVMATPLYAPPEIVTGEVDQVNIYTDMYSFGGTLYHMLAGEPPFAYDDANEAAMANVEEEAVPLTEYGISEDFSTLIQYLMEKDPALRPVSWDEVVELLDAVVINEGPNQSIKPEEYRKKIKILRFKGLIAKIAILYTGLAILCGTGVYWYLQKTSTNNDAYISKKYTELKRSWGKDSSQLEIIRSLEGFFKKVPPSHPLYEEILTLIAIRTESIVDSESNKIDFKIAKKPISQLPKKTDEKGETEKDVAKNTTQPVHPTNPNKEDVKKNQSPVVPKITWAPTMQAFSKVPPSVISEQTLIKLRNEIAFYSKLVHMCNLNFQGNEKLPTAILDGVNQETLPSEFEGICERVQEWIKNSQETPNDFILKYVKNFQGMPIPASVPEYQQKSKYVLDGAKNGKLRYSIKKGTATIYYFYDITKLTDEEIEDFFISVLEQKDFNNAPPAVQATVYLTLLRLNKMRKNNLERTNTLDAILSANPNNNTSTLRLLLAEANRWEKNNIAGIEGTVADFIPLAKRLDLCTEKTMILSMYNIDYQTTGEIKNYLRSCSASYGLSRERELFLQNLTTNSRLYPTAQLRGWIHGNEIQENAFFKLIQSEKTHESATPLCNWITPLNGTLRYKQKKERLTGVAYTQLPWAKPMSIMLDFELGNTQNINDLFQFSPDAIANEECNMARVAIYYYQYLIGQIYNKRGGNQSMHRYLKEPEEAMIDYHRQMLVTNNITVKGALDVSKPTYVLNYIQLRAQIENNEPLSTTGLGNYTDVIQEIENGVKKNLTQKDINNLIIPPSRYHNIVEPMALHALLSVINKKFENRNPNVDWKALIEKIEQNIPDNLGGYPLWHDLVATKISLLETRADWDNFLTELFLTPGIFTVPDYPGILYLYAINSIPPNRLSDPENIQRQIHLIPKGMSNPVDENTGGLNIYKLENLAMYPRLIFWYKLVAIHTGRKNKEIDAFITKHQIKFTYAEQRAIARLTQLTAQTP